MTDEYIKEGFKNERVKVLLIDPEIQLQIQDEIN